MSPTNQAKPVLDHFRKPEFSSKTARVGALTQEVDGMQAYREAVADFSKEAGRKLVFDEHFSGDTSDFRSLLLKMKQQKVSFFFLAAVDPHTAQLVYKQMEQLDFNPELRWLATELDQKVFSSNPELFNDVWLLNMGLIGKKFSQKYLEKFNSQPDLYPAIGYDAARSLIRALRNANSQDFSVIVNALEKTRLTDTAFQGFRFDFEHGVLMDSQLTYFKRGKLEFVGG